MWLYKIFTLLILCFLLTACGFHPLYTSPCGVSDISYPIKIATIQNRNGQILRNYLVDLLTPAGQPVHPEYILEIKLIETVRSIGINKNETTSREETTLTAYMTLRDTHTNKIVYTHAVRAINSFSILSQNYYADVITEDFAKKEAARLLAEKIALILSVYLDTHCG